MARRIMYVQLKTGFDLDRGPSWIAWVRFSKTWRTAYLHGRTLRRWPGRKGNFFDVETGEEFWVSGPKRDRADGRYGSTPPVVEGDAEEHYDRFLLGAALPGRERG
ncbi:hypothetical protein ACFPM7_00915 [Actinokineospora guangxiensis]|uniref:Uncharacterized protein n=1 Tax=Actinokineospora guangxiensis TaxID=1490288 RepID=A0ABW0EH31_9PSEU